MRLGDLDALKAHAKNILVGESINTVLGISLYKILEEIIDNTPTVEPCYQNTSCLDCGNYDKENHNCPRYCGVIKEAINSRPQGEWKVDKKIYCSECGAILWDFVPNPNDAVVIITENKFCFNCGSDMRKGSEMGGEANG